MNWFGYKNISKTIITTTIVLILSNTLLISLFYYQNQVNEYEKSIELIKQENLDNQILYLKKDINHILEMIKYKYSLKQLTQESSRKELLQWLKQFPFDRDKSDYVMIYQLFDIDGGDKFAKLLVNPNRPDLIGKFISTNYQDKDGFHFRKKMLEDINNKGDSVVSYVYKKLSNKMEKKVTYFKYYEPLNWIIAKGVYQDDIQHLISPQKQSLKDKVVSQIQEHILYYLLFTSIAIIFAYLIGRKIENIIRHKEKQVQAATKKLVSFNKNLDKKVKAEIEKNKEQEDILMQKSKFVAIGEMISMIAHQWRQPISELNAIILNIKLHHKLDKLDHDMIEKKSFEIETLLKYMSTTIEDFRTFFKPNKQKEIFNIEESTRRVLHIVNPMLNEYKVAIIQDIDKNLILNTYQNELEQVLLNIITNAKDALVLDSIVNPKIKVHVHKKNDDIIIEICDNANGIKEQIINKIFDPYFTTKDEANGTGIGLYMSKIIIEKNMGGKLNVTTSENGSCFSIVFTKEGEVK